MLTTVLYASCTVCEHKLYIMRNKSEINSFLESEINMRKSGFASDLYSVLLEDIRSTYKTFPHKSFPNKTFPPQNVSQQNISTTKRFLYKNLSIQNLFFSKRFLYNMFPATKRFLRLHLNNKTLPPRNVSTQKFPNKWFPLQNVSCHKTIPAKKRFLHKMFPLKNLSPQNVSCHKTFPHITFKPQNVFCYKTLNKTLLSSNVSSPIDIFCHKMFPATKLMQPLKIFSFINICI